MASLAGDVYFSAINFSAAGDEIGEGIFLLQQAAGFMPRLAQVHAAADVRNGVDEAAVEQAQPVRTERRIDADAVRAVAVEQHRCAAVAHETFLVDQRNRDLDAVRRRRVDSLGLIESADRSRPALACCFFSSRSRVSML